jgi:hypothetical protein
MKKLLLGIGVGIGVVTALILAPIGFEPVGLTNASNGDGCPDGSYNIGITKDGSPLCKLEPTGCPYGDSIPLDSPKCAPSPEELAKQKESEPINVPTPTNDTRSTSGQEEQPSGCFSSK